MWIKYIVLENFKGIETGLGVHKLKIDFSKRKNKICLFVAPNGSGKTTILSCLTPFATLGNLDIRDSDDIIIESKDGYKELVIMDGMNEYLIKHFYTPSNKTHTTKSYIFKNGIDLNPNGNVRSFQSIVKEELGIELSYLKLIRLGNNVTNMINLSATERKSFMSKLLDELDVYLNHYKKLNEDFKQLKSFMSHTMDRLKKLGIEDKEDVLKLIDRTKLEIDKKESELIRKRSDLSVSEHELLKLPTIDEIKVSIQEYGKKVKKLEKSLDSSLSIEDYRKLEANLSNQFISQTASIESMKNEIKDSLNILDDLIDEESELLRELKKIEDDEERNSIEQICRELRKAVNDDGSQWDNFHPSYTKKDIDDLLVFLMNIQDILTTTYEFGKKPISKVIKLLRKNKNVNGYIDNKLLSLDSSSKKSSILLEKILSKYGKVEPPSCGDTKCQAYQVWLEFHSLMHQESDSDKEIESEEFYKYMDIVYKNIKVVIQKFNDNKDLIEKLPDPIKEMFRYDVFLSHIEKCEWVYDRKLFYDLLSEITEYENHIERVEKLEEAEARRKQFKKTDNSEFIKKRLKFIKEMKESNSEKIENHSEKIKSYQTSNESIQDQLNDIRDTIEAIEKKDENKKHLEEYQRNLEEYSSLKETISKLQTSIYFLESDISKSKSSLSYLELSLSQYVSLTNDMNDFQKKYDELSLLLEASSSRKGIPLLYIDLFMSDMKTIANDLLDIAYNGKLFISKFEIEADRFNIPYVKNNKEIKDISLASQGEQCFLSIAISFAMSYQSLSKYNIMLLDEIDGALDPNNREKFINVLEHQIELIDAEQVFLITHNNLFSMYPVDIVELKSDVTNSKNNYNLATYIPVTLDE